MKAFWKHFSFWLGVIRERERETGGWGGVGEEIWRGVHWELGWLSTWQRDRIRQIRGLFYRLSSGQGVLLSFFFLYRTIHLGQNTHTHTLSYDSRFLKVALCEMFQRVHCLFFFPPFNIVLLPSQNRKQEVFLSFTRAQSLQWQAGRTAAVWVKPLVYFMIKGIYLPVCPQNSHVHLSLAASCVRIRMKW